MNKKRFYYILLIIISFFSVINVKALELESGLQRNIPVQKDAGLTPIIEYQAHVGGVGWQNYVDTGDIAGTTGKAKALEAIRIKITSQGGTSGSIEYQAHVGGVGWQNYVTDDHIAGTTGQAKALEAVKIRLTGDLAAKYDIYYRVHVGGIGWLDWASNDQIAGTVGYSKKLEAIEIRLVEKGALAPGSTQTPNMIKPITVMYQAHVGGVGWQDYVENGQTGGTTGKSKALEALKIMIASQGDNAGSIEYQAHVGGIGWQNYVGTNQIAGTTGQSKAIEAVKIKLTGDLAAKYDIYYRVHVGGVGWLDWASNDQIAGTVGYSKNLEAIEIKLAEKGQPAPGSTQTPNMIKPITIMYQAHVGGIGWQDYMENGELAGSSNYKNSLEALKMMVASQGDITGSIEYQAHVGGVGWQNYVGTNQIAGTTGQAKALEALRVRLTGDLANKYDIYYRVYVENVGWLDWASNDQVAGTVGYGEDLKALEMRIVEKGQLAPGDTTNPNMIKPITIMYQAYVAKDGWQEYMENGETSGTTGEAKSLEALKMMIANQGDVTGSIEYSTHVSGLGWQDYVGTNQTSGIIGQGRTIEAIRVRLTGDLANKYDLYYRVHVGGIGWMTWTSNDQIAGTSGAAKSIEAIEMKLVEKGGPAPENIGNATDKPYLEAYWVVDEEGKKYYYDLYGNLLAGGGHLIGDTIHYFGPTGVYLGTENLLVIDVSAHQEKIDWQQVAGSGIYGVIIRISAGCDYEDSELKNNIEGVKKYNIPYGIYIYSYAENYAEGVLYGQFTQSIINKYEMNPTLGIYLDLESNGITQYMGVNEYTQVVQGFMSVLPHANIYTYTNYANTALNSPYLRSYITWIAHYAESCGYTGSYKMWQYTSSGSLPGINGSVDMNILYSI